MHYQVTFEIINCDCEIKHPLATNAKFEYSYIEYGKTENEAIERAMSRAKQEYCSCSVRYARCVEYVKPTPSLVAQYKDVGNKSQARES